MRGKALHLPYNISLTRITPAHAGKSAILYANCIMTQDHPRPCGEKEELDDIEAAAAGSPPPMRGKVRGSKQPLQRGWDHPRPCGEKAYTRA